MDASDATLQSPDVEVGPGEVDLIPSKVNCFTHPETMSGHQEDQGCVTLAPPAFTRCADEFAKLGLSEVPASIAALHRPTLSSNFRASSSQSRYSGLLRASMMS